MRGSRRTHHALSALALAALACFAGCDGGENGSAGFVDVPGTEGRLKSSAAVRLARRAFEGAPPVIPHAPMGAACLECHNEQGLEVAGLGFAPAMPHASTDGLSDRARCVQCHLYRTTDALFTESDFIAFRREGTPARRAYDGAPPVLPHRVFMREACLACHSGPAAREGIRTSHPERPNCVQCHLPAQIDGDFSR